MANLYSNGILFILISTYTIYVLNAFARIINTYNIFKIPNDIHTVQIELVPSTALEIFKHLFEYYFKGTNAY